MSRQARNPGTLRYPTKPNKTLLRKLRAWVLKQYAWQILTGESQWNQSQWVTDCGTAFCAFGAIAGVFDKKKLLPVFDQVVLNKRKSTEYYFGNDNLMPIVHYAEKRLGLSEHEARVLSNGGNGIWNMLRYIDNLLNDKDIERRPTPIQVKAHTEEVYDVIDKLKREAKEEIAKALNKIKEEAKLESTT